MFEKLNRRIDNFIAKNGFLFLSALSMLIGTLLIIKGLENYVDSLNNYQNFLYRIFR